MLVMRILGVDDNPDILRFVEMTVETLGHDFDSAGGGREGLEKIRNEKFDLVFLDLSMPEFSGIDVINALDKEDLIKKQHIVLFTASYLSIGTMEKELQQKGIHSILSKPADIDDIIDTISNIEELINS